MRWLWLLCRLWWKVFFISGCSSRCGRCMVLSFLFMCMLMCSRLGWCLVISVV